MQTPKIDQIVFPELGKQTYNEKLQQAQLQLMKFQHGLFQTGKRAVIVFAGTDASGKGGTIQRLVKNMDSRGYRVHAIGAPSAEERAEHYLQRFWRRLPKAGQLAIFDRSWYGRVLVERVEGHIDQDSWEMAYDDINHFEQTLVNDGILLIKLFLYIDKDEQKRRFISRYENPEKRWKLTKADLVSRQFWPQYQAAYQQMFERTSTQFAPWHLIGANNKLHARVKAADIVLDKLDHHIDLSNVSLMSPEVQVMAKRMLDVS